MQPKRKKVNSSAADVHAAVIDWPQITKKIKFYVEETLSEYHIFEPVESFFDFSKVCANCFKLKGQHYSNYECVPGKYNQIFEEHVEFSRATQALFLFLGGKKE